MPESGIDPGCVKTPKVRKPGEWLSQIAQIRPCSEIVIAPIAIQGEICPIDSAPAFSHSQGRVEERRGCLGHAATLRFLSPLIEPDMQISSIRLSDKTSRLRPRLVVAKPAQTYESEVPV